MLLANGNITFPIFYSQGGKIRAKLVAELGGAEGVVMEEGTAGEGGKAAAQDGMRRSIIEQHYLCYIAAFWLYFFITNCCFFCHQVHILFKPSW